MPGVEIHANAIQTIIEQKFLVNQNFVQQLLTVMFLTIISTLAFLYLNIWLGVAILILLPAGYTAAAHLAYDQGLILNMANPYIAIAFNYLASLIYRYFAEIRSNQQIKSAFAHYVNPHVVEEISKNPDLLQLGGQKRELTVFFSDIENFTNISEKLAPEALVELMNEYLDVMTEIILNHGGTLDKYEGDAIMAFFNAPLDQPDHPIQAAQATLECRAALKKLQAKWQEEGKPVLNFRVGLATGEAIVGNMGSKERFDYTAMGDTINTGSRLESANKTYGTHILVNEATAQALVSQFYLREIDLVRVKGKDQPIQVYELLAPKGQLPEAGIQLIEAFHQGLQSYRSRNFAQALDYFKKAQEIFPEDAPTKLYIHRCRQLQLAPPTDDWDGVFVMRGK